MRNYDNFLQKFKPIYQHNLNNSQHQYNSFYHVIHCCRDYRDPLRKAAWDMVVNEYCPRKVQVFCDLYRRAVRKLECARLHIQADVRKCEDKQREIAQSLGSPRARVLKEEFKAAGNKIRRGKGRKEKTSAGQLPIKGLS